MLLETSVHQNFDTLPVTRKPFRLPGFLRFSVCFLHGVPPTPGGRRPRGSPAGVRRKWWVPTGRPPPAAAGLEASAQPSCLWRVGGYGGGWADSEEISGRAGALHDEPRRASLVRPEKRYARKETKGREKDAGKTAARSAVPLNP